MPRVPLDVDDPRVAELRGLPQRVASRASDVVVEGVVALSRAWDAGFVPHVVLATAAAADRLPAALVARVDVAIAPERVLADTVGYPFHRGCIALVQRPGDDVRAGQRLAALAQRPWLRLVAAHRIADAANVGALVRTARAFGVDVLALDAASADPWSRRAVRAAMGHTFAQTVLDGIDTREFVAAARDAIPQLVVAVASVRPQAVRLGRVHPAARTLVLFGNEGDGLPDALLEVADLEITIPMRNGVDSLNVASAAAVILWALGEPRSTVQ